MAQVVDDNGRELGHVHVAKVLEAERVGHLGQLSQLPEELIVRLDFLTALEVRGRLDQKQHIEVVQIERLPLVIKQCGYDL